MPDTQAKANALPRGGKLLLRILGIVLMASLAGWVLNRSMPKFDATGAPAGFGRGLLHGALMPCALPNLLAGHDVTIYAPINTGRTYKLGYTAGVNGCGAIFFGLFFWRLNRWRKALRQNAAQ